MHAGYHGTRSYNSRNLRSQPKKTADSQESFDQSYRHFRKPGQMSDINVDGLLQQELCSVPDENQTEENIEQDLETAWTDRIAAKARRRSRSRPKNNHEKLLRAASASDAPLESGIRDLNSSNLARLHSHVFREELELLREEGLAKLCDMIEESHLYVDHSLKSSGHDHKKSLKAYGMQAAFCHICARILKEDSVDSPKEPVKKSADAQSPVWDLQKVEAPDSDDGDNELNSSSKGWNFTKRFDSDSD